ncbi:putative Kinesin-13 5 [Trypanosoma cruzi]|nr:putative Kinesin-13 5 [Trypanosoma cruzi]
MIGQMPSEEVETLGLSGTFAQRRAREKKAGARSSSQLSRDLGTPNLKPIGGGFTGAYRPKAPQQRPRKLAKDDDYPNFSDSLRSSKFTSTGPAKGAGYPKATPKHSRVGSEVSIRDASPYEMGLFESADSLDDDEDNVILGHRRHIDAMMELLKQEMTELNGVEMPGASIETYCRNVDSILTSQAKNIEGVRSMIRQLMRHVEARQRR